MSSTTDKISGLADKATGAVKEGVGKMTGDSKLEAEGAAQKLKGDAEKATGDVKGAVKDAANKTL